MLPPEYADLVKEVVDSKVANQEMFTAFDVSLEVKSKCKSQNLPPMRHSEMKADIHNYIMDEYISTGLYNKSLHDVGAPSRAFLYHSPSSDPNNYVPMDRSSFGNNKPQDTSQSNSLASLGVAVADSTVGTKRRFQTAGEREKDGTFPDKRKSIRVMVGLLRQLGLEPKDTAYISRAVINNENHIVVSKNPRDNNIGSYTVNPNGGIAITSALQYDAAIHAPSYDVCVSDFESQPCVLIKAHK